MTTDLTATFERIFGPTPTTTRRVLTDAEQDAEDYAATVGENQRDNEQMADVDDRWMQERADNDLMRETS